MAEAGEWAGDGLKALREFIEGKMPDITDWIASIPESLRDSADVIVKELRRMYQAGVEFIGNWLDYMSEEGKSAWEQWLMSISGGMADPRRSN